MKIVDLEWDRLVHLANQGLDEHVKDPPPSPDILDILSWTMIGILVIGLVKNL